jgi:hypothetical protein
MLRTCIAVGSRWAAGSPRGASNPRSEAARPGGVRPGRRRAHLRAAGSEGGLYFGAELPADDPRVLAGVPLHGANLFPRQVPRPRPLVLADLDCFYRKGTPAKHMAYREGIASCHGEAVA